MPEARVAAMPPMLASARIDREEQTGVAQVGIELVAGDAGLDQAVQVLGVDLSTWLICERSSVTLPQSAAMWPSSEVPVP